MTWNWRKYDVDLAGLGLLVAILFVGYIVFIGNPLADSVSYESVKLEHAEMQKTLRASQAKLVSLERQVENVTREFNAAKGMLPGPVPGDQLLAQLDDIAMQCGIVVARWEPTGRQSLADYQVDRFVVDGKASFPALYRWFSLVEAGVPHLDITNFSVRADNNKKELCDFHCSIRYYSRIPGNEPLARLK